MTGDGLVVVEMTAIEAAHMRDLVTQFVDLLAGGTASAGDDPAIARLVPDAYRDDDEAAAEYRRLTESDLLDRRLTDAQAVAAALVAAGVAAPAELDPATAMDAVVLPLTPVQAQTWLRTLAALRLVLASRLGVVSEDDHDPEDPRFGIYEWVGFRLDGLVQAIAGDLTES